jgi:hypothetical protein
MDSLQYENILNLDLEMPERTTHDYDGMMLPADAQYAEVRPQPTATTGGPLHRRTAPHRIPLPCVALPPRVREPPRSAERLSHFVSAVCCALPRARARAGFLEPACLCIRGFASCGGYAYDEEDIAAMMAACELRLRIAFMLLLPSSSTVSVLALCAPFARLSPIRCCERRRSFVGLLRCAAARTHS